MIKPILAIIVLVAIIAMIGVYGARVGLFLVGLFFGRKKLEDATAGAMVAGGCMFRFVMYGLIVLASLLLIVVLFHNLMNDA